MTRCVAPSSSKLTSQMRAGELARIVAEHQAWTQDGGWIFAAGVPVAQGYDQLGRKLELAGVIVVGKGVAWSRLHDGLGPRLRRMRTRQLA